MKWLKVSALAALALSVVSCNRAPKADTPEGALHRYVTLAFDAKSPSARQALLDLSTGDARAHLASMSDEDFKRQFVDSHLRFLSMQAKDMRTEVSGDVSLVYELNYKQGQPETPTVYTTKKIAYLTHDANGWKIKSTRNMKTFIERKEEILVTPDASEQQPAGK